VKHCCYWWAKLFGWWVCLIFIQCLLRTGNAFMICAKNWFIFGTFILQWHNITLSFDTWISRDLLEHTVHVWPMLQMWTWLIFGIKHNYECKKGCFYYLYAVIFPDHFKIHQITKIKCYMKYKYIYDILPWNFPPQTQSLICSNTCIICYNVTFCVWLVFISVISTCDWLLHHVLRFHSFIHSFILYCI
jgi:hypothetical protein